MSKSPIHRVVVAAMIENDRGELLVAQRPQGKWGAGKWEFPGGKLEEGEDPKAALHRECEEELGVSLEDLNIFDVICHQYDKDMPSIVLLFFTAKIKSGEARPLDGGAIEWSSVDRLLEYDWLEADWPIVHKWIKLHETKKET